jgi:hypothetical protein
VKINYCSAPCGSGKTYQLVKSACRLANSGETVLFLQPTKELIDRTIDQELLRCPKSPPHEKIYGVSKATSVARRLTEYLKHPMDGGHIVFATHQVLPFVQFWANQNQLHVLIDEELQIVKHGCFQIPNTHQLVTNCIDLGVQDAIYSRVVVNNHAELEKIAKNSADDEIYERFRETAQILVNPHWDSFVNAEQFEKLRAGKAKQLSIHSVLKPDALDGFASVTMASANFQDTLLYKLWSHQGVQFEEDKALRETLQFQEHQNGRHVSVKYLADRVWSWKLQRTPVGQDSETALDLFVEAVKHEFQDNRFLWQGNRWITEGVFGSNGQRLPNVPHGLNDYSNFHRIAFLSALNPKSDHFRFLESRGVDADSVRRAIYCSAVYQSVMRTSIRDPDSTTPKTVIVPDVSAARYLQEAFPGAQIEKLATGLIELETPSKLGRPRKYSSVSERKRKYRLKKRKAIIQTVLQLEKFPYVGQKKSCDEEGSLMMGDEKGIDVTTHFVPLHQHHGTLYRDKKSKTPLGYLSGGNTELFLGFLEHLHTRTVGSKEANVLISPADFDPNLRTEGNRKRGLSNIVAVRHLWMDFENGDLHPAEIAELFPNIRLAVFNTYNHTNEAPRFRVVIPFDEPLSPADYTVLYDNVIAKMVDAGYSVGQSDGSRRSGLDISKKPPTSLFYLPCQAKDASQSFFKYYTEDMREMLDPMKWIVNTVVHFPTKTPTQKYQVPQSRTVNHAAAAEATRVWRQSRKHPGEGNARFFNYAVSLRSAGMPLEQIEQKLREEAQYGRSPAERTQQIPSIMQSLRQPRKKLCLVPSSNIQHNDAVLFLE